MLRTTVIDKTASWSIKEKEITHTTVENIDWVLAGRILCL